MVKCDFIPKQKLFLIVKTSDPTQPLSIYLDPSLETVQRIPKISHFLNKKLRNGCFLSFPRDFLLRGPIIWLVGLLGPMSWLLGTTFVLGRNHFKPWKKHLFLYRIMIFCTKKMSQKALKSFVNLGLYLWLKVIFVQNKSCS